MLPVELVGSRVEIGGNFLVEFQRTLRIPDDGKVYPLPPGLGAFPIFKVDDYADKVPPSWREHGGIFIPMYQREALWLNFNGREDCPMAVKVAVGMINAVTGKPWNHMLAGGVDQDYVVCPGQPWIDGIKVGLGQIRQFVAMPLGMGYTVEGQVTGKEEFGGIQLVAFLPKPEMLEMLREVSRATMSMSMKSVGEMGLGAGGKMSQKIYPDKYGVDFWDVGNFGRVYIHIVNSLEFRDITGLEAPPTPISAKTYTQSGLPWFNLYDEQKGDLGTSPILSKVKPIKDKDQEHGFTAQQDDSAVHIPETQIKTITEVRDGVW